MDEQQRYEKILAACRQVQARGLPLTQHRWGVRHTEGAWEGDPAGVCPLGCVLLVDQPRGVPHVALSEIVASPLKTSSYWTQGFFEGMDEGAEALSLSDELHAHIREFRLGFNAGLRMRGELSLQDAREGGE